MLFGITRKEYKILKTKYQYEQERVKDLEIVNEHLKETIEEYKKKIEEYKFREIQREEDITKLNNAIANSMEERNRLNGELIELKNNHKRGKVKKKTIEKI